MNDNPHNSSVSLSDDDNRTNDRNENSKENVEMDVKESEQLSFDEIIVYKMYKRINVRMKNQ